ncbi:alpha/beta hydrolase [Nonomuraea sp. B10E15]|uniref:alpha/beta hydrolase n=1 Tax=Nonomuraea sp. B10E15 TaxID=3153560 RepID=UPI00325F93BC
MLTALFLGGYVYQNVTGLENGMDDVAEAGFVEKQIRVDGRRLNYAEGPDNGPPLVLIHGQASQWEDYMLALPELAGDHHIFAVDVPGHGGSDRLDPKEYSNARVGALLAGFMEEAVGEPAIVSGHSSGGLLALWITAQRRELVSGLVLEDPPLFSSEMPRLPRTTGGLLTALADQYLKAGKPRNDFQRYFLEHGSYFEFFGSLEGSIKSYALNWIDDNPRDPLQIFYLPPLVSVFFQGLVSYDPEFGAAWTREEGGWFSGFDTEAALRAVNVPTTLIHTNYFESKDGTAYNDKGILMAAMDAKDVDRALGLLPKGTKLVQVQSGHLVHFEKPRDFIDSVQALSSRVKE